MQTNIRRLLVPFILSAAACGAPARAAAPPEESCPLARQPYSVDTPVIDLLLNPKTRHVLHKHGLLDKIPPALAAAQQPPTFLAIVSARIVSKYFGLQESTVDLLATDLGAIPVTTQDSRARCARYDIQPPQLTMPTSRPAILVFDKSVGFRDGPSVDAANALLKRTASSRGWALVHTSNAAVFDAPLLRHFDVVVWNNVSGDVLTIPQRSALSSYIESGGGFAGFHGSGGDPLYLWDWYADSLIGARFTGHPMAPQFQDARLVVEDQESAITRGLGSGWMLNDEWYSFKESPRARGAHILVTIDEASYNPVDGARDLRMGDHPIAWTRCVGKGRSFYSAIGHRPETYSDAKAAALLEGGIAWAAGLHGSTCRDDNRETGNK
jgi:type 1 glutamine amidotransferase